MKKTTLIILAVCLVGLVGAGVWIWAITANSQANKGTDLPGVVDLTNSNHVNVSIHDLSFSPINIKIKKGTTVTWTNQDNVLHDVVADDPANSGGLPATHSTFARDGTYSNTFSSVGVFSYHCSVHTFMQGAVEVVN